MIIAAGTPDDIAAHRESPTGHYLGQVIERLAKAEA
jgi:excinuclease UvrABC ATPase subunit